MTPAEFFRSSAPDDTSERPTVDRRQGPPASRSTSVGLGTRRQPATLLLSDPDNTGRLTARPVRGWIRLFTRVLASSLDRQLAEGRSPESHPLLAARAQVLVSPVVRRDLVDRWERLLAQACRPAVMRDPRAPFNRHAIIECEGAMREMLEAISTPLPVPARGTAMASWLLRDGTGPIYNRECVGDLGAALSETIAQLDASLSL